MSKIKKKSIKFVKHIDSNKQEEYEKWRLDLKKKVSDLKSEPYRIIYLDETVFTSKTIRKSEYTSNRDHLRITQTLVNQPVYALIFAISEEKGIEYSEVFEKSVNKEKFTEYVLDLRRFNQFDRIAVFLDNMSVHKSNVVKDKLQ